MDLGQDEVLIDEEHYAGTPNQCSLCKSWQVDMIFEVPADKTKIGAQLKAAGQTMILGVEMMGLYFEHLKAEHDDEAFIRGLKEGWEKKGGSPSD